MSSVVWSSLSKLGREAARIVLPSPCVVCDGDLPWHDREASCCARCWRDLPRLGTRCRSCALALPLEGEALTCLACATDPPAMAWVDSWGAYRGGLERVLHAFKFERHDFLDRSLASLLVETFGSRGDADFDRIVPVPMHRRKLRQRGYNQAELLARHLGRRTGIPLASSLLRKPHETRTQSQLPREERAGNVRRAFEADDAVEGRSILLVDDICTTGETLRACANALLRKKARRVAAITVARA